MTRATYTYDVADELVENELTGIASAGSDGVRDADDRSRDRDAGDIGEAMVKHHFAQTLDEDEWEHVPDDDVDGDGWEYDFIVNGAKVDVKTRETWLPKTPDDPDMLVRFHENNEPRTHAHLYVFVLLNGTGIDDIENAEIVGFSDEDTVADADEFFYGKQFKTLVSQDELTPMDSIETDAQTAVSAFNRRGGHRCMLSRILDNDHARIEYEDDDGSKVVDAVDVLDVAERHHNMDSCSCEEESEQQGSEPASA